MTLQHPTQEQEATRANMDRNEALHRAEKRWAGYVQENHRAACRATTEALRAELRNG